MLVVIGPMDAIHENSRIAGSFVAMALSPRMSQHGVSGENRPVPK
jgi:hypothetical protein